nr:hypothetical protein [Selenomonas caprae]
MTVGFSFTWGQEGLNVFCLLQHPCHVDIDTERTDQFALIITNHSRRRTNQLALLAKEIIGYKIFICITLLQGTFDKVLKALANLPALYFILKQSIGQQEI